MQFNSPLRYPGGKGRLTQYVADLIALNGLTGGHYAEPYAGGAAVALGLMYLEYVSHIHLNDLNRSVHAFWTAVLEEPEALSRLVRDTPLTVEEWQRQRTIQRLDNPSILELGFSTLYMNRTNRSGVVKGGIIGGLNQTGPWKLDARFNRTDLIRRIEKAASYRSRISVYGLDALNFMFAVAPTIPRSSLIYLDPPYFRKADKLYDNHYKKSDHAEVARRVAQIDQRWIVSYDSAPEIRELYSNYRQQDFGIRYSVGERCEGREVMIFSDDLEIPAEITTSRSIAA